jgi:ubiquinone/menaquinone biosynthesis C-methylase UbiE
MTEGEAVPKLDPRTIDFEQGYQGKAIAEGITFERLPWDIGRPQPLLVEFERARRITGEVLDIGCGPGDTVIYLAELGYHVTGLDVAPTAIEQARSRAAAKGVAASFAVGDATVLDGYDDRFDTVVSSALLHCLDQDQRRAHVAALRRVLRPGGRLIQFCFSQSGHSEAYAPYQIGEEELRTTFSAPGWTLNTLRTDRMVTIVPPPSLVEMLTQQGFQPEFDETGAMLLPVWVLEAERA